MGDISASKEASEEQSKQPKGYSGLPAKCINGALAGVTGVTCIFPIDLVKTRLQNQQVIDGRRMYKNLLDCFIKTAKADGIKGLYKGYGINVALISPEKSIKLVGNDFFRYHLQREGKPMGLHREMLAGGGAGLCQVIITTPMEMLKIQLQDAGRKIERKKIPGLGTVPDVPTAKVNPSLTRAFSASTTAEVTPSALTIARNLLQTKGVFGLYRGLGATLMRDIPFSMIYFPLFAHLNAQGMEHENGRASFQHSFVCGCLAATVASLSVNPVDVIKTRLQLLQQAPGEHTYTGIRDCAAKIWKYEGPSAFFKGASCRLLVISPLFGIAQAVYYFGVGEFLLGIPKQWL
ncbi:mitochondrial glutamate carrier 2-like isoform X1 [Acanthaster planci]|uniref:Mitochondrial glutamate carrier 2 n=1 Tax=Acanthaster planci TaxID=133434 RepID=A0A8B7XEJ8_ACAPL|nr:mitochondrial glutamate carrier 2-like isoform X1 [Acanthaster planci]XP_022079179.1 mitochondrial glutamate carrier 2-like isoform X1 [Acanthaster planci]